MKTSLQIEFENAMILAETIGLIGKSLLAVPFSRETFTSVLFSVFKRWVSLMDACGFVIHEKGVGFKSAIKNLHEEAYRKSISKPCITTIQEFRHFPKLS